MNVMDKTSANNTAVNTGLAGDAAGGKSGDKATIHARYHAVLAMEAAKRMKRTRQKRKTGHEVCHHLAMMLASGPVPRKQSSPEPQFQLGL